MSEHQLPLGLRDALEIDKLYHSSVQACPRAFDIASGTLMFPDRMELLEQAADLLHEQGSRRAPVRFCSHKAARRRISLDCMRNLESFT